MAAETLQTGFPVPLFQLLEETFEKPVGIYLDADTSLFQTLDTITSEQASIPVGGKCASLAAQVAHVTFFMEAWEHFAIFNDKTPVEWSKIWRTVDVISPEEWETLKYKLKAAYERISHIFHENKLWNEDTMGGALSIVVHTAYHLGEIRQALCMLK